MKEEPDNVMTPAQLRAELDRLTELAEPLKRRRGWRSRLLRGLMFKANGAVSLAIKSQLPWDCKIAEYALNAGRGVIEEATDTGANGKEAVL